MHIRFRKTTAVAAITIAGLAASAAGAAHQVHAADGGIDPSLITYSGSSGTDADMAGWTFTKAWSGDPVPAGVSANFSVIAGDAWTTGADMYTGAVDAAGNPTDTTGNAQLFDYDCGATGRWHITPAGVAAQTGGGGLPLYTDAITGIFCQREAVAFSLTDGQSASFELFNAYAFPGFGADDSCGPGNQTGTPGAYQWRWTLDGADAPVTDPCPWANDGSGPFAQVWGGMWRGDTSIAYPGTGAPGTYYTGDQLRDTTVTMSETVTGLPAGATATFDGVTCTWPSHDFDGNVTTKTQTFASLDDAIKTTINDLQMSQGGGQEPMTAHATKCTVTNVYKAPPVVTTTVPAPATTSPHAVDTLIPTGGTTGGDGGSGLPAILIGGGLAVAATAIVRRRKEEVAMV